MILRLSWRLLPTVQKKRKHFGTRQNVSSIHTKVYVDLSRKLYDEKQALLNQMSIAD